MCQSGPGAVFRGRAIPLQEECWHGHRSEVPHESHQGQRVNGLAVQAAPAATPYGLQHLLGQAVWSADAARDALYAYVAEHLRDPGGVVVGDATGGSCACT